MLEHLILAGMNVARLNFSHGTHEEHAARIACIRSFRRRLGKPVGILQDLQGPKIRVGVLDPALELAEGEMSCLFAEGTVQLPADDEKHIPVVFAELFDSVAVETAFCWMMVIWPCRLSKR